jgi:hypothetical protein
VLVQELDGDDAVIMREAAPDREVAT